MLALQMQKCQKTCHCCEKSWRVFQLASSQCNGKNMRHFVLKTISFVLIISISLSLASSASLLPFYHFLSTHCLSTHLLSTCSVSTCSSYSLPLYSLNFTSLKVNDQETNIPRERVKLLTEVLHRLGVVVWQNVPGFDQAVSIKNKQGG